MDIGTGNNGKRSEGNSAGPGARHFGFDTLPDFALEIIKDGGLLEHIRSGQGSVARGQEG